MRSFCSTISTLFNGAVPAFDISIMTKLFTIDVSAPDNGFRLTILSPVSLKVKGNVSFLSPDSLSREKLSSIVPE